MKKKKRVHFQCVHGDARCASWYESKRATCAVFYWNEDKSFIIKDYTPSLTICSHHSDRWYEDLWYMGDKAMTQNKEFGQKEIKPARITGPYDTPDWARNTLQPPRPARYWTDPPRSKSVY